MTHRIAILISGQGTNMEAIFDRIASGDLDATVAFVASDNDAAAGLRKAAARSVPVSTLPYEPEGKMEAERALASLCRERDVDWIVLAGFMRILSAKFISGFENRIVNIHPALLPAFPGAHAVRDAWDRGVRLTGVTVHLVDTGVDTGPILSQRAVSILDEDTIETLEERIHATEHIQYWETLRDLFSGRLEPLKRRMNARRTA
jgi:formyltetrahydrofolate-dependent phosphoribosylglycinamide formyltransferase